MSGCIYCIDNDILKKLATFQLFDSTLEMFDIANEDIRILETARYKFQKDWKKLQAGKNRHPAARLVNWTRVLELTQTLPIFSNADIDLEILARLSDPSNQGIDEGEALLVSLAIAIVQRDESAQILTGDKRFIQALAQVDLPIIHQSLKHRIWCLEQIVLKNIDYLGFEEVRTRIVPVRDCDIAIKSAFGSGDLASEENSRKALQAYIEELKTELLFPFPSKN